MENKTEVWISLRNPSEREEVIQWLDRNATGKYQWFFAPASPRRKVVFELEQDAIVFALKWSNQ